MKISALKKTGVIVLFSVLTCAATGQVPLAFNYQAIARDGSGNILADASLPVRLNYQTLLSGGTLLYQETFASVVSNKFGLISIIAGTGTNTGGDLKTFAEIDWKAQPVYLKTEIQYPGTTWTTMGTSQILAVPYALVAKDVSTLSKLAISSATDLDEPLFEVRNKAGNPVFSVYNNAVRAYVGKEVAKGVRGGFSVGGYDGSKGIQDYLKVYGDSTRVYVKNQAKGVRGGFSVGGYDGSKGTTGNFLNLTKENYFIGHEGGLNIGTGMYNSVIGYQAGKSLVSGSRNTILGHNAATSIISGDNNIIIGDSAAYKITSGGSNTIIGYRAGYSHTTQVYNVIIGHEAGNHLNSLGWAGAFNTFLGVGSGWAIRTSRDNTFIGINAGMFLDNGRGNTFLGTDAGRSGPDPSPKWVPRPYTAEYNTFIGNGSGYNITTGSNNVAIGYQSGLATATGAGNVFIGNQAGASETGSNKLYIANTSSGTPLLYGDFSSHLLGINTTTLTKTLNVGGDVSVTGNLTAVTINGSLTGSVTGNVNGNLTGNVTGSVNGIETGRIYVAEKGDIQYLFEKSMELSYDPGAQLIRLTNYNKDYPCSYFYRIVSGSTTTVGSGTLTQDQYVTIISDKINNYTGFEIHFGQATVSTGYCSTWFQFINGVLVGHYIKE